MVKKFNRYPEKGVKKKKKKKNPTKEKTLSFLKTELINEWHGRHMV